MQQSEEEKPRGLNPYQSPPVGMAETPTTATGGWKLLLTGVATFILSQFIVGYMLLIQMPLVLSKHEQTNSPLSMNMITIVDSYNFILRYWGVVVAIVLSGLIYAEFRLSPASRLRFRFYFGMFLIVVSILWTSWIIVSVLLAAA